MRLVILSAGKSSRFFANIARTAPHKSLWRNRDNSTILGNQLRSIRRVANIGEIILVFSGDKASWEYSIKNDLEKDVSANIPLTLLENDRADEFGSYRSIYKAINALNRDDDVLFIEGDIFIKDSVHLAEFLAEASMYRDSISALAYAEPIHENAVYLSVNPLTNKVLYDYDTEHKQSAPKNSAESCQIWFCPAECLPELQENNCIEEMSETQLINWDAFRNMKVTLIKSNSINYINVNQPGDF